MTAGQLVRAMRANDLTVMDAAVDCADIVAASGHLKRINAVIAGGLWF